MVARCDLRQSTFDRFENVQRLDEDSHIQGLGSFEYDLNIDARSSTKDATLYNGSDYSESNRCPRRDAYVPTVHWRRHANRLPCRSVQPFR